MRAAIACAALLIAVATARADGELTMRGVYYKERATRVEQPMLDARFDVGDHGTLDAHLLVDAITSASVAAGADGAPFEEKRVEAGAGYTHGFGVYTAGVTGRYSSEPDYKSGFATVRGQAELFDKNLTVGLTAGAGHDAVSNAGSPGMMRITGALDNLLVSASVAQILGRNTIGSLVYDLSYLDGFQQNPYRQVGIAGMLVFEKHPTTRTRHAAAAMLRRYLPSTSTTVIASYRLYRDDWGVLAHTPELRLVQDVGDSARFAVSYRLHHQRAADFWKDTYAAVEPYVSADPKLAGMTTQALGAKLVVTGATLGWEGRWSAVRGELMIEYYLQDDRFFGNATIAHAALTLPFEY